VLMFGFVRMLVSSERIGSVLRLANDGPIRSSDEGPRNGDWSEGIGSSGRMVETTGNRKMQIHTTDKPFNITKKQVYEAYKAVKSKARKPRPTRWGFFFEKILRCAWAGSRTNCHTLTERAQDLSLNAYCRFLNADAFNGTGTAGGTIGPCGNECGDLA